jgi:hypothetical protein
MLWYKYGVPSTAAFLLTRQTIHVSVSPVPQADRNGQG